MLYFICWAAFLGILILATILTAVMGKSGGKKLPAVEPMDSGFDEAPIDEAVADEPMDMQEVPAEAMEEFAEPAGDDFAEFENEFK